MKIFKRPLYLLIILFFSVFSTLITQYALIQSNSAGNVSESILEVQNKPSKEATVYQSISNPNEFKDVSYNENDFVGSLTKLQENANSDSSLILRGFVASPDLQIEQKIYEGSSNRVLALGAGTIHPNEKMGEGNFAISAHNFLGNRAIGFGNLQYFKDLTNKNVYTFDGKNIYQYQTFEKRVVDDVDSMPYTHDNKELNQESQIITLYTCLLPPNAFVKRNGQVDASQRILLQGRLVKSDAFKNWDEKTQKLFSKYLPGLKSKESPENNQEINTSSINHQQITNQDMVIGFSKNDQKITVIVFIFYLLFFSLLVYLFSKPKKKRRVRILTGNEKLRTNYLNNK